jgi:hypothetical protein
MISKLMILHNELKGSQSQAGASAWSEAIRQLLLLAAPDRRAVDIGVEADVHHPHARLAQLRRVSPDAF